MKKTRMKKVSTQMKVVCSFYKFPLSLTRYYSTIDCSLAQLSEDIEFIYNDLIKNTKFSMSRVELGDIQQKFLSGFYVLSPLRVKFIRREDLSQFLHETLPSCPDFTFWPSKDQSLFIVVMPCKEDVLVLMGLSLMLYRLTHGGLPKEGYRITNRVEKFHSGIKKMGKVNRLYRLDLNDSLRQIPVSLILDKVKPLVGEGSVCYKLIKNFLYTPTLTDDGKLIYFGCMPSVGEISRVLFNIVLMDFDRELAKKYPGIAFERFISLVILSNR